MLVALAAIVVVTTACAGEGPVEPGAADGAPPTLPSEPDDELPPPGDGGDEDPFGADFDRDEARERAEALLGLAEDELPDSGDVRVIRRGDERPPVTMDLRIGRRNVELDPDGSGTFRVVLVQVEVPDEEPPLVVE